MTKPTAVRRAAAEADRLLAEQNTPPAPEVPTADTSATPAPDQSASPSADPVAAPAAPPTPAPGEDFRTKYDVLRNKYDQEVPTLQNQIAEQNERIRGMERMLQSMAPPAAPTRAEETFEKYVKDEDVAEYGKDFFDVVGRKAREIVSPEVQKLRKQVEELEKKYSKNEAQVTQASKERVFELLNMQMPDWQTVNVDQGFLAWLGKVDVISGRQRKELLTEAFENLQAERVVAFFKAFKEDSGTAPTGAPAQASPQRAPQVPIENLVAPGSTRAGAPEAPGEKRVWTNGEIAEFYRRRQRKMIPDEEFRKVEREILEAVAEGRVQ